MAQKKRGMFPRIPTRFKKRFEDERLDTNVRRMLGLSIYLVVLQLGLNIFNILIPQRTGDGMPVPLDLYIGLSLLTLLIGVIFWIIFGLADIGKIKNRAVLRVSVQLILYLYLAIQLAFCTFNIISNQGVNSLIMLLVVFSMIPIIPRRQSIVTILGSFFYVIIVLVITQGVSGTAVSPDGGTVQWTITSLMDFIYSDMCANLLILTIMSIIVSTIVYNLYVSNFLKKIELENRSEVFEQMVLDRTQELAEQTEAAQAADRAKTRFLASMSHEIRTPLNAVVGMAHVARKTTDPQKSIAALDQVTSSANHLLNLLNDVLDMSNIESGSLSIENGRFLLSKCLQEVAASVELKCAEKHQIFETNVSELEEVMVIGDKLRLKQVLFNLLDNAVKYSPEYSRIAFGALLNEGVLSGVPSVVHDNEVVSLRVTVADNGLGIDEATRAKLFEPFERGDGMGTQEAGSGLGLPIAQALIGMMGSSIELTSEQGWTSVFRFSLVLEKASAESERHGVSDFNGKHLLYAEDIEVNRLIVREMLSDTNISIDEAEDGAIALERFVASPEGYYDFIFMDLLMPRMDGLEATRNIRALKREDAKTVPIIAVSANSTRNDIEQSKAAGMDEHIAKPISYDETLRMLAEFSKRQ
jgi:signal transduction histidine kinase/BarA-like signal transduction histidine kinase